MSHSERAAKDSAAAEKQKLSQQPAGQAPDVLQLGATGLSGNSMSAAGLPSESNTRRLRQAHLVQLQRTKGNRHVQRYLAGSNPHPISVAPQPAMPSLQRQGPKAGASVEAGSSGIKVELSTKFEKEIPMKYAVASITPKMAAVAELKPSQDHPASASVGKEGAKASLNVYQNEARAAGSAKFGELAYQQIASSGWEVEKVDWDSELGLAESAGGGGQANIATGVKFTFKNGHEAVVKAQLFERSVESGLSGPKLSVEPALKFLDTTLWDNGVAKLTMNGEFKVEMSLKPNWMEIFKELARSGGRAMARQFAQAAMRGAAGFLLGPGGLAAGGALTIFAYVQSVLDIQDIKECRKQAVAAVGGYVRGWCISWGIDEFGNAGSEAFFYRGIADGRAKLAEAVKQIQQNPVFAPWNFTEDELRPALKAQLRQHGGQVYRQVEAEVREPIYRDFVLNFYQKQKAGFFTPKYIARKNAIWVARGLGLKNAEALVPDE